MSSFKKQFKDYEQMLKRSNITHERVKEIYPEIYGPLGNRTPYKQLKRGVIYSNLWNFAGNHKFGTKNKMEAFLAEVDNHIKNSQLQPQPIPQSIDEIPDYFPLEEVPQHQPAVPQIQQSFSSENLKPNNHLFQNSEMSGFEQYANAYAANIGKGRSEDREAMRREADSVLDGMTTDEIKLLAKRYLVSGAKTIAADPEAQYGGYDVMPMNQETADAILAKPKNAWAKFIANQPSDIKFKPNMLHDQYSAWYAAKNGLQAWKGDFNSDGVADYMITDERGKIKYYNGYGLTPSKQAQYIKYNEQNPFSKNEKGAPYRPSTDPSFREWTAGHARYLQQQGELKSTNKNLAKGMVKYKPRYKTLAEIVKDMLNDDSSGTKPIDQLLGTASNNNAAIAKAIKKTCNITKLVSIVLKPVLLKISQGDPNLLNNVKVLTQYIQKEVQPVLNVQNEAWLNLKMAIANDVMKGIAGLGVPILKECYKGTAEENIMATVYGSYNIDENLKNDFAGAKAAKDGMKNAWKEAHPKTKALGKVKQTAHTKSGGFNANGMDEEAEIIE